MGDWFDTLNSTGQVALQTYGNIKVAQAQASAAPALAAQAYANQQASLANAVTLSRINGGGWSQLLSGNGLIFVMLGIAALFVINQANK